MISERGFIEAFIVEAEELLVEIDQAALCLENGGPTQPLLNRLFRAFHTIKGSSAVCGLEGVVNFTHHVENLLDLVLEGKVPVSTKVIDLILRSGDQIAALLDAERGCAGPDDRLTQKLVADLCECAGMPVEDAFGHKTRKRKSSEEGLHFF